MGFRDSFSSLFVPGLVLFVFVWGSRDGVVFIIFVAGIVSLGSSVLWFGASGFRLQVLKGLGFRI